MKEVISSNQATAYAVMSGKPHVISAYPITPQSSIVEMIAELCAKGELQAQFINVESEHSAMAACIAASATGARTFTATSSQGLALMHELLHYASGLRLPMVMANVNRALAAPFNIKADWSDSLSQRDTGWIQFYCESAQEVFDTIIQAFKISERVLLPVMVNFEGFILSHTYEIVDIPMQEVIDSFLPPSPSRHCLDVENPYMLGGPADSDYIKFRYKLQQAMEGAKTVCSEIDNEFARTFGRGYGLVQTWHCEDPDIILITAGTIASTCCMVADRLKSKGLKIGVLRIRLFRPFPEEQVRQALQRAKKIAVIDRDLSPGCGGIFAQEIKAALQGHQYTRPLYEYIAGLGGRDVTDEDVENIVEHTHSTHKPEGVEWMGLTK
jgi:pyruvate/2-oxoacid:ferredoxin oxidoreductase alpha subunit